MQNKSSLRRAFPVAVVVAGRRPSATLLALLILGLFLPSLAGAAEVSTIGLTLSSRQQGHFDLDPTDPVHIDGIQVEGSSSLDTTFISTSQTLEIHLVSPAGETYSVSQGDFLVYPYVDETGSETGARYQIHIALPVTGAWILRVEETSPDGQPRFVFWEAITDSPVRIGLISGEPVVRRGSPVTLVTLLTEGAAALTQGLEFDAVLTHTTRPEVPETPLTFRDDGEGADRLAGDGLWVAEVVPPGPGKYLASVEVRGTTATGEEFLRQASTTVQVAELDALLPGTFTDLGIDFDGDGYYDQVAINLDVEVLEAGRYVAQVLLRGADGSTLTSSGDAVLGLGDQVLNIPFTVHALRRGLAQDGPWELVSALLYRDDGTLADRLVGLGWTSAYLLSDLERRPIELVGQLTWEAVDTNLDDQYDYLDVHLTLAVELAGQYNYSAFLQGPSGQEIDLVAGAASFGAESPLTLRFSGPAIAASGLDGPYAVRGFVVYNGIADLSIIDLLDIPGLLACQFAGHPQPCGTGGASPVASVDPTAVQYPAVVVGGVSAARVVTVSNTGSADLDVTSLALTGSEAADFRVEADTCDTPVAPGSDCQVRVQFAPIAAGSRNAVLEVATNDSGSPLLTVALGGEGFDALGAAVRVMGHRDDAEESTADGSVTRYSSDLELTEDGGQGQWIGLRFRNLPMPQGAVVVDAFLDFTTDSTASDQPTSLVIHGLALDDPSEYSYVDHAISAQPRTTQAVAWNDLPIWQTLDEVHRSPDLRTVVQEIVDRPGWTSGKALALVISGSGWREAYSHDGDSTKAPLLTLRWVAQIVELNHPPRITSTPATTQLTVGSAWSYPVTAVDDDAGDLVTFSVEGPAGLAIDPQNGMLGWTPDPSQTGTQIVTVRADDGRGGVGEQSLTLRVAPVLPPAGTFPSSLDLRFDDPSDLDGWIGGDLALDQSSLRITNSTGAPIDLYSPWIEPQAFPDDFYVMGLVRTDGAALPNLVLESYDADFDPIRRTTPFGGGTYDQHEIFGPEVWLGFYLDDEMWEGGESHTPVYFRLVYTVQPGTTWIDSLWQSTHQRPIARTLTYLGGSQGELRVLDASGSFDPDGDSLTGWQWTQVAGTAVSLVDADQEFAYFVLPTTPGSATFSLVVTDEYGAPSLPVTREITW